MSVVFGLAPMEGVSDWPFRLWFSQISAPAFMSTPFLRATDTFPKYLPEMFAPELSRYQLPYALIPQVMASRADDFIRTARLLLDGGAEFVDLNCGCPSPSPVSGGAGSSLLKNPGIFLDFVQAIAKALPPHSFSVKMRTGFDDTQYFSSFVHGLRDLPLKRLTIHGRTRRDRYDGDARWDLIRTAQEALPFPVVASGDVVSWESWSQKNRLHPGLTTVMVGRGALRNPWIFEELKAQTPVAISRRTLVLALASFGRIMDLSYHFPQELHALVASGLFANAAGSSEAAWEELWAKIGGEDLAALKVERFAFGRTKMVWNSLRSSLPAPFFEPSLLRKKSLGEFLAALQAIDSESFVLRHNPELDWLYTSSRKKAGATGEGLESE